MLQSDRCLNCVTKSLNLFKKLTTASCKIWIMKDLDCASLGLGKIWIMEDLDCTELGLCKIWIMEDLDHGRFGSCKVWIVHDLDRTIFQLHKI